MGYYEDYTGSINEALTKLIVTNGNGEALDADAGFKQWSDKTKEIHGSGGNVFFTGNGASAAMASHMSADANKNGELRAMAFNDISMLTAVSNDISYEQVFATPLRRFGKSGDILITISSSGNSPNIVAAINAARDMGMYVITLSGMKPDNKSRQSGDLNFYIENPYYGQVECGHQVLLHCWLDMYMEDHLGKKI